MTPIRSCVNAMSAPFPGSRRTQGIKSVDRVITHPRFAFITEVCLVNLYKKIYLRTLKDYCITTHEVAVTYDPLFFLLSPLQSDVNQLGVAQRHLVKRLDTRPLAGEALQENYFDDQEIFLAGFHCPRVEVWIPIISAFSCGNWSKVAFPFSEFYDRLLWFKLSEIRMSRRFVLSFRFQTSDMALSKTRLIWKEPLKSSCSHQRCCRASASLVVQQIWWKPYVKGTTLNNTHLWKIEIVNRAGSTYINYW